MKKEKKTGFSFGLPLAIELAATRIKLLSPQAIFDRLENSLKLLTHSSGAKNLPSRQRTMRETIQWSYDLLGANEKVLFRRLAIFVGGFSIEAAEAVVSGAIAGRSVVSENLAESGEDAAVVNDNQQLTTDRPAIAPLTTVLDATSGRFAKRKVLQFRLFKRRQTICLCTRTGNPRCRFVS